MSKPHRSVLELAKRDFQATGVPEHDIASYCFCDNQKDADECAELVLSGDKRATASSMWWYKNTNEKLPEVGDINIVTNWEGQAQCVIQVSKIEMLPFNEITKEFAEIEGEGDKSLTYWKKVHWDFFTREMQHVNESPNEDMLIVCEYFDVIYTPE